MPVHDWNRVDPGIFHHFQLAWCTDICTTLNTGVLPFRYYALVEDSAGRSSPGKAVGSDPLGLTEREEIIQYAIKRRTLVVRHESHHHKIALIEILAPGDKSSRHAVTAFLDKTSAALVQGIQLLMIDLHAPGPFDPKGIHGALWRRLCDGPWEPPAEMPLMLAAYTAAEEKTAYVEPVAVGDILPDMPLFLDPEQYVAVPLEKTYQAAYSGVPRYYRDILEA
jgi:hypothetical protein